LKHLAGALLFTAALLVAPFALAQTKKVYSPYEQETIAGVLDELGATIEPAPDGKVVEEVVTRRLDVIEPRDPVPGFARDFLNLFHATSRSYVVEREVLQKVGNPWDPNRIDESERNLRGIRQLSYVLVVPIRGSQPDRVKMLVITKDIWSLRLNSDLRFAGGELEYLLLQPSEENLFGSHQTVSGKFVLEPDVITAGGGYRFPRNWGTRQSLDANAAVIVNRQSGDAEGSTGGFSWGMPLRSTHDAWAWSGSFAWRREISRRFIGIDQALFDAPSTEAEELIPAEYTTDLLVGRYAVTRSFGQRTKNDFTAGVEAQRSAFRAPVVVGQPAEVARDFEEALVPVSDTRVYPFVSWNGYSTTFLQITDFSTLALQENYRLGHDVYLKLAPIFEGVGSSRDIAAAYPGAAYTIPFGDGFVRLFAEGSIEAEIDPDRIADAAIATGGLVVTPRLGFGRLVLDIGVLQRFENFLNQRSTLGGDGRLRGYPTAAFLGENVVAGNLEFRSRPVEIATLQLGAVAFFDAGTARDEGEPFDVKQAAGAGLRLVIPQLNRSVLRLDWGFPLVPAPELGITSPWPGHLVFTFDQAFDVPVVTVPSATL
jgi:hypothetical protein